MELGPVAYLMPSGVWQYVVHIDLLCWVVVPFRQQPYVAHRTAEELFGNQSSQQLALWLLPGMACVALWFSSLACLVS